MAADANSKKRKVEKQDTDIEDQSIVVVVEDLELSVCRDVLARHSVVFKDMLLMDSNGKPKACIVLKEEKIFGFVPFLALLTEPLAFRDGTQIRYSFFWVGDSFVFPHSLQGNLVFFVA